MTLPRPYYEEPGIQIFCGDCREILPELEPVDLVLTDPPYGIGYKARCLNDGESRAGKTIYQGEGVRGDESPIDRELLLLTLGAGAQAVIFGGNYYSDILSPSGAWIVWDKKKDPAFYGRTSYADCEMAWCSWRGVARLYAQIWNGIVREGEESASKNTGRAHPTQKPLRLMAWCIQQADKHGENNTILDPFMGSGTTLIAARSLGRRAIGIEIEQKYCDIAIKRLSQQVLPMFANAPKEGSAQEEIFNGK